VKPPRAKAIPAGPPAAMLLAAVSALAAVLPACRQGEPAPVASDPLSVITTPSGVEMVLIPGGRFRMGSAEKGEADETAHEVELGPFAMDRCEVTQEHYEKVMGENPSRWKAASNPVEQIRWPQAAAYCNARSRLEGLRPAYDPKTWQCDLTADGYRLPTEAEWEYAARAGTGTAYSFGDNPAELGRHAWFKDNSLRRRPSPVGQKEPNPWGLFDMYGNVWEWCNDWYEEDYYQHGPEKDPPGPERSDSKVLRGGSWYSRAEECRSAYRLYEEPAYRDICFARDVQGLIGFRCVRKGVASSK